FVFARRSYQDEVFLTLDGDFCHRLARILSSGDGPIILVPNAIESLQTDIPDLPGKIVDCVAGHVQLLRRDSATDAAREACLRVWGLSFVLCKWRFSAGEKDVALSVVYFAPPVATIIRLVIERRRSRRWHRCLRHGSTACWTTSCPC